MSLFTKKVEKIVYVDTLQEWKKNKVGDFFFLDRVWVTRTIEQSERSHPKYPFDTPREDKFTPIEGIIIGESSESMYSHDTDFVAHDGWKEDGEHRGGIKYRHHYYRVLTKSGNEIYAHTIKKSHGEFQEEFDHMNALEQRKLEIERVRELYEKSLQDMEKELEKGKDIQKKMVDRLIK